MVEDVKYLIKAGAWVSIYDLKSEAKIKNSSYILTLRRSCKLCLRFLFLQMICWNMDLIILSHEYPRDSSFLKAVHTRNSEIKFEEKEKKEEGRKENIPATIVKNEVSTSASDANSHQFPAAKTIAEVEKRADKKYL